MSPLEYALRLSIIQAELQQLAEMSTPEAARIARYAARILVLVLKADARARSLKN
jgi:hypothetical protein